MNLFDNVILKTEIIDENPTFEMKKEDLHIAFGIDANFAIGMGVCMTSIALHNQQEKINFHVFTDGIQAEDFERLKQLTHYKNVKLIIYYINKKVFEKFPTSVGWTYATYYRFIMGKVLYGQATKVLYLDADVLCIGSLKELIEIDMGNNTIIGICDFLENFIVRMQELSIKNGKYFNAGVMYIDVERWCEDEISERAIQLLSKDPTKYKSLDQDVLNVLLDGKVKFVNKKWDYMYNTMRMKHALPDDTILIHFTGDKPWQSWTQHHFLAKYYMEYIQKSPWFNVKMREASSYKEKRKLARSYFRRQEYIIAIQWYWKYLVARQQKK